MSFMDELFFRVLFETQGDLLLVLMKKKYYLLVPPTKCISANMLTNQFYENHCFYQSEYDDRTYLNLQGKVLELNNNTFQTHLGYKKVMYFNIIDESIMETLPNVQITHIDNIIDESMYQTVISSTASIYKKEMLRKCPTKEDYLSLFDNLLIKHNELSDLVMKLSEIVDKLQNNYVLLKNHVTTYSKHFRELGSEFKTYMANRLIKFKVDESYNIIVYELAESLIFNRIYPFIYFNIKNFNFEEETQLKTKLNQAKSEFTFTTFNVDPIINLCKFNTSLQEIRKLPLLSVPFEKLAVLTNVFNSVVKEINDIVSEKNKHKKVRAQITANELVPIWMYLVVFGDVENILTEICIMQDFMLKDTSLMNETGYHLINLINAVESFKGKESETMNYTITPSYFTSPKSNYDTMFYENLRSLSFASTTSQRSDSESLLSKFNIFK